MKRWLFREPPAGSPPRGLARALSISPLLLDILWRRGLDSPEELDAYLSARLPDLVPPSRWPQFPQAAEVISKALLDGKKLAVWGDYDVDGITSSTLVLDVLEAHGLEALWHVPDRRSEGYGLNIPAIEELAAQGCGILLTVDCGISDMAAVARARELGMTVVISDHHLPPPELPPAAAICNPRLGPEDDMPCPHLAGVGVAFFLMAAVNAALAPHTGRRFKMDKVLDLVALGTLADVMRLGGQNRILVRGGLDKLVNGVLRNLLRALREDVTPRQREMLLLYYGEQLNMRQIGTRLGVDKSTVSRTIKRGERRLQRCLRYGAEAFLAAD